MGNADGVDEILICSPASNVYTSGQTGEERRKKKSHDESRYERAYPFVPHGIPEDDESVLARAGQRFAVG